MEQTLTSSKQLPHPISWNVGQKTSEIKTRPKVSGFDGVHFWWALSSKRKHCVRFSSGINSCESLVRPPNTDKNDDIKILQKCKTRKIAQYKTHTDWQLHYRNAPWAELNVSYLWSISPVSNEITTMPRLDEATMTSSSQQHMIMPISSPASGTVSNKEPSLMSQTFTTPSSEPMTKWPQ